MLVSTNVKPRAYSLEQVAKLWECSPETVRNLCQQKKIRYFRVGKMYRIKPDAVEEYEECQTLQSESFEVGIASHGTTKTENDDVISLRHSQKRKPIQKQ